MTELDNHLKYHNIDIDYSGIETVEWITKNSQKNSVLFYRFHKKDSKEISTFQERIKHTHYHLCITNLDRVQNTNARIYSLDDDEFIKSQQLFLNHLYPLDLTQIKLTGVTGTNGKTTVVNLVEQILLKKNVNVLTIGTLGVRLNGKIIQSENLISSLSYIDLHKTLFAYQKNIQVICMELTSHGLEQQRYGNLLFDAIAWTNFSQDHLDYHGTMENYFKAKLKSFRHLKKNATLYIPNSQKKLLAKVQSSIKAVSPVKNLSNPFFDITYNKENLSLALCLINEEAEANIELLENLKAPEGRYNIQQFNNSYIIIDYAHTPDGLRSICKEIKHNYPDRSLICLFGCGGDRDKKKRPLMGEAASEFADFIILTTDNPRSESPLKIIQDIIPGISKPYYVEQNREMAIKFGIEKLDNSILLIAGKGHENYIEQKGKKIPYSDQKSVDQFLKGA